MAIRLSASPSRRAETELAISSHKRAEHWVVTQGRAIVQVGDEEFETGIGEYRYIPLGEKHRLTNIGDRELVLIEVGLVIIWAKMILCVLMIFMGV